MCAPSRLKLTFYKALLKKLHRAAKNVFIKVPLLKGSKMCVCVCRGVALLKQLLYQCVSPPRKNC